MEACTAFHRRVGNSFTLRFKRRAVPMRLRHVEVHGRRTFIFQLGYPVTEETGFTGMRLFVGCSATYFSSHPGAPHTPDEAYVANIHALPRHRWTGSDMIELALDISRAFGVKLASLTDMTFKACKEEDATEENEKPGHDLSMIMLLSRQVTFYGRFGFRPVVDSIFQHGVLVEGDPIGDLCSALALLGRLRTTSFVRYLSAMLKHLDPPSKTGKTGETGETGQTKTSSKTNTSTEKTYGYRLTEDEYYYGVLQTSVMGLKALKATIPLRIPLMKRLLIAFKPHRGLLLPLFADDVLSCSAKSDFLSLLEMGYPTLRQGSKLQVNGPNGHTRPRAGSGDVEWPAWTTLTRVSHIRDMRMQAVVQADPAQQRVTTFCPMSRKKQK